MVEYEVLVDSDAFIGLMVEHDAHHPQARTIFQRLINQQTVMGTTNYVITETASTLSYRFSLDYAKNFLTLVDDFLMITITPDIHTQTSQLFRQQDRAKTSFVDMSNVTVMKALDIPAIFSFDTIYQTDFQLSSVTHG
ncbi:MAG: PIN domain-containing protein [Anaerolineae bacterium]